MWLRENPVLQRELIVNLRTPRAFLLLLFFQLVLSAVVLIAYPRDAKVVGGDAAKKLVDFFLAGQFILTSLMAPSFAAGTITGEKERKTYEMLLASPLSPTRIVLGKLIASLTHLFVLMIASLPIIMLCLPLGGVSPLELLITYPALLCALIFFDFVQQLLQADQRFFGGQLLDSSANAASGISSLEAPGARSSHPSPRHRDSQWTASGRVVHMPGSRRPPTALSPRRRKPGERGGGFGEGAAGGGWSGLAARSVSRSTLRAASPQDADAGRSQPGLRQRDPRRTLQPRDIDAEVGDSDQHAACDSVDGVSAVLSYQFELLVHGVRRDLQHPGRSSLYRGEHFQ
jgi:ABC-type transport system involved in cytochrome c biogenesis permease component